MVKKKGKKVSRYFVQDCKVKIFTIKVSVFTTCGLAAIAKFQSRRESSYDQNLTDKISNILVTYSCSICLTNGLILILFLLCVGVGIVASIQSSRGSVAPTDFAFNTSR